VIDSGPALTILDRELRRLQPFALATPIWRRGRPSGDLQPRKYNVGYLSRQRL
jgi:hypothetical protein